MSIAEQDVGTGVGPRIKLAAPRSASLPLPEAALPVRLDWGYVVNISLIHVLSALMFVPWFFSWTGVVVAVLGFPFYGLLGITLCYHRILTHKGLTVPKWLERTLALIGVCSLQDTPARWVAVHRLHHQHSDRQDDPHTPLVNFLWAHMGWVLVRNRQHSRVIFFEQYARDVLRDPLYLWRPRRYVRRIQAWGRGGRRNGVRQGYQSRIPLGL
jgi:stearoyl-CoA desaturase (delta-9 desaturase)